VIDTAVTELGAATGQRPIVTRAKKAIAAFKLREGMRIGVCVTLRRERMWAFMERLVMLALAARARLPRREPARLRWRRAITLWACASRSCSQRSNLTKVDAVRGMNITFVTTCPNQRRRSRAAQATGYAV
jgi:large subunit ribosomal protein L5